MSKSHSSNNQSHTQGNGAESNSLRETAQEAKSTAVGSIEEALRYLDKAIVDNKDELQRRLSSDFSSLKSMFSDASSTATDSLRKFSSGAVDQARDMSKQTLDKSREVASQVNTSVRQNPWSYVGGVALGSLIVGMMLGRSMTSGSDS